MIRRAVPEDAPGIGRAAGAAFEDDPVAEWYWPKREQRRAYLTGWYELLAETHYIELGAAFVAEEDGEIAGCAMWSPPGSWRLSPRAELRTARYVVPKLGLRLPLATIGMRRMESRHPEAPHWYLSELGVRPESQGRGLGSQLMFETLARCDRDGTPAYLESSTERSRALYERHGFAVTDVIQMPRGGPSLWLMWREPNAASAEATRDA